MRFSLIAAAVLGLASLSAPAVAANICQADTTSCATTMPIGGYCQCTARGQSEPQGGTVVARTDKRHPVNGTAGGCGSQPNAPGCR